MTLTAPSTALTITGKPTSSKEKGKKYSEFNYAKQKIKESKVYNTTSNFSNGIFYGFGILPLLCAFGLGLLPKYEKKEDRFISGKKISQRVMQQMKQAEVYLSQNNKEAFYQELTRTYWNYLSHKLRLETSDLTRSNIADKLKEKGVDHDLIIKMINLIDNSEMGLYTNYGTQGMQEIYDNSLVILNDMDRQIV